MRKTTVWTDSEWTKVCEHILASYDPVLGVTTDDVVAAQQARLPVDRQRERSSLTASLGKVRSKLNFLKQQQARLAPPPPPEASPLEAMLDEVSATLAKAIAAHLRKALTPMFVELAHEAKLVLPSCLEPQTKLRPPTVLVLGPKEDQQAILNKEFDGIFHLKYAAASTSVDLVLAKASAAQATISWTNFAATSHEAAVQRAHLRLIRVSGGMTSVVEKLQAMAAHIQKGVPHVEQSQG